MDVVASVVVAEAWVGLSLEWEVGMVAILIVTVPDLMQVRIF